MMLHSSPRDPAPSGRRSTLDPSAEYLVQVQFAHEQLLKAMGEMAVVTDAAVPDKSRFTTARWRIAQASRVRLELWERVREHLYPRAGPAERELLSKLAAENAEVREAGSAIIARWPLEAIYANWPEYCRAAREIRWKQMAIVRHEQRDLLPMLKGLARG